MVIMQVLWGKLTNKQLWQDIADFASKTLTDPNFYYILAVVSVLGMSSGGVNELKNFMTAIAVYTTYQNRDAVIDLLNGLLVQLLGEILNKSDNETAQFIGQVTGYLTLEVATTFFSAGVAAAVKNGAKLIKLPELANILGDAALAIGRLTNMAGTFKDEFIDIAGQWVLFRKLATQEVGIWGSDALRIVDNANDSQFVEFVGKVSDTDKYIALMQARRIARSIIQWVNPETIRFSQSTVKGSDYDIILKSMKAEGWLADENPIDIVRMSDGVLTTADNKRLLASKIAKIQAKTIVHEASELLPEELKGRFVRRSDGSLPKTWGEAIRNRIEKQSSFPGDQYGTFVEPRPSSN
jgi:hypothetical protein